MDPDVEIIFVTKVGKLIPEHKTSVYVSPEFSRRTFPGDQDLIDTTWISRLKHNPRLFNGTKFRLHSVSSDSLNNLKISLGLTDYREYLGTNWSDDVRKLQLQGQREFGNPQAFLADPMGVGAFVVTDDEYVIFLKRSLHCAEAPAMWDIPGGHAEPEQLVGKVPISEIDMSKMSSEAVAQEIYHSILREIRDEVNIGEDKMSEALLMGIAKNLTSGGRPSLEFLVRCSLSKDQVLQLYQQGSHAEADESTSILLLPVTKVVNMLSKDPALWAQVAPSAKGCVLLYKLCHGF